jgi:hypothetical protein
LIDILRLGFWVKRRGQVPSLTDVLKIISFFHIFTWGCSSGGERLTHIQEVQGSNPCSPTSVNTDKPPQPRRLRGFFIAVKNFENPFKIAENRGDN